MLKPSNPKARNALEARQRALEAKTIKERNGFLVVEKSWLKLAASYEFSERLERFAGKDFPEHPICSSCAVPMWLVEMNSTDAGVQYRYECKVCSRTDLLNEGDLD